MNAIAQQILLQFCSNRFRENCVRQIETSIDMFYSRKGQSGQCERIHAYTYIYLPILQSRARTLSRKCEYPRDCQRRRIFLRQSGEIMAQRHDCHPRFVYTPFRGIARRSNKRSVILVNRAQRRSTLSVTKRREPNFRVVSPRRKRVSARAILVSPSPYNLASSEKDGSQINKLNKFSSRFFFFFLTERRIYLIFIRFIHYCAC